MVKLNEDFQKPEMNTSKPTEKKQNKKNLHDQELEMDIFRTAYSDYDADSVVGKNDKMKKIVVMISEMKITHLVTLNKC